ncbi:hypothetical protein ES705_18844 [subsurface metagenome]
MAKIRQIKKTINGSESPLYISPRFPKPVNVYPIIRRFRRIVKLQKQAIDILKQEIEELKSV